MNADSDVANWAMAVTGDAGTGGPSMLTALGQLLQALAPRQGLMVGIKDGADGRYLLVSPALAAFFGRAAADVTGHADSELVDAALATLLRAADQTALAQGGALASDHRFEWRGQRHDWSVLRLVTEQAGRRLLCSLWQDRSAARQNEAQLRAALEQLEQQQKANEALRREFGDQALRDSATGLYTHAHFDDQMRREVDLSTREHREFALVHIVLDPFSDKVLGFGERAQERIYEAMGRLLRGNTRAMDASCRIDERNFAVLLSGVGLATAHSRMEGLRRQCATQIVVLEGQELGFTVSMGVASFPHTAQTLDEVSAACAAALAEARRRGGNTVALASIRFDAA